MKLCIGVNAIPCPNDAAIPDGRGVRCRSCGQRIRQARAREYQKLHGKHYHEERKRREREAKEHLKRTMATLDADEKVFSPKQAEKMINQAMKLA